MNIRTMLAGLVLSMGFFGMSSGCSSARSTCALVCECEHCGDLAEELTCTEYDVDEAIAQAYGCDDAWEAYMTCVQEKGTCDAERARFTTRANGTCSETDNLGVSCMTNADCQLGLPGATSCSAGACVASRCSNGGDYCAVDNDCLGQGEELCDDARDKVDQCIEDASGGAPPQQF
jgi:hypothetical protein